MDEASLGALPAPYALALRLQAEGQGHDAIAEATGVPLDAVGALLDVGSRKLAAVVAAAADPIL